MVPETDVVAAWRVTEAEIAAGKLETITGVVAEHAPFESRILSAEELGDVHCDCGGPDYEPLRAGFARVKVDEKHCWHRNYLLRERRLVAQPIVCIRNGALHVLDGAHRIYVAFESGTGTYELYCGSV